MEAVRIIDLVDDSTSMIAHEVFEEKEIRGPAILVPLSGYSFIGCTFEGSIDSLFIVVPDGTTQVGVIGLEQVVFRKCRFRNVGLMGTEELAQKFGQDFLRDQE